MRFQILMTDVTDFGDLRCVAGWDLKAGCMVRPEPGSAAFWDQGVVGPDRAFWPGHIVEFEGKRLANQQFPHGTEDVIVDRSSLKKVGQVKLSDLAKHARPSVSPTLEAIFGGALEFGGQGAFIKADTKCSSLGAIEIGRNLISFGMKTANKLRCHLAYGNRVLNLGVTAHLARKVFLSDGLSAVGQAFPTEKPVHIRIGLSRPFAAMPNQCFVQINGIYSVG